jgi:hypothetical protein
MSVSVFTPLNALLSVDVPVADVVDLEARHDKARPSGRGISMQASSAVAVEETCRVPIDRESHPGIARVCVSNRNAGLLCLEFDLDKHAIAVLAYGESSPIRQVTKPGDH